MRINLYIKTDWIIKIINILLIGHNSKKKVNYCINQPINQWINQSIHQSINQSIHPSIHQFINSSINQSINQSINKKMINCSLFLLLLFNKRAQLKHSDLPWVEPQTMENLFQLKWRSRAMMDLVTCTSGGCSRANVLYTDRSETAASEHFYTKETGKVISSRDIRFIIDSDKKSPRHSLWSITLRGSLQCARAIHILCK